MDTTEKASGEEKEKVTGNSNHMLAYFGALLAIVSLVSLILFFLQLASSPGGLGALFSQDMLYLQFTLLAILLPSVAFCSYLSYGLKLTSRFYRSALTVAAVALLPIFPCVSLLGIYFLWLRRRGVSR